MSEWEYMMGQRVAELEQELEEADAKLEAVRGLQRYRVEPLNPEYYERGAASFTRDPNGDAVMYSELEALLNK